MNSAINSASIVCDDEFGITYRICRLDYEEWEDGSYEYRFTPCYHILDMLPCGVTGGIPGLDLDLRREVYVRKDMDPVFMTERSPSRNRVDVRELMDGVGLDHYDRLEWLIRTHTRYAGDELYCIRYGEPDHKEFSSAKGRSMSGNIRDILSAIGSGSTVSIDGKELSPKEMTAVGRTLRMVLSSERRVNPERTVPASVGRKRKEVGEMIIDWACTEMRNGASAERVAKEIGISRATLYRRIKEHGKGVTCR